MTRSPRSARSGRHAATLAIAQAAQRFPDLPPSEINLAGLSAGDAALALAIHRTVLQRWLTLEHLLDRFSRQPCEKLEPNMLAVLLTGSAQLVFMPSLPTYAVVDEAVSLAKQMVRPAAGGMVNAILRKVAKLVVGPEPDTAWQPAADLLPAEQGVIRLAQPALPDPSQLPAYLAAATSHPVKLVRRWIEMFGGPQTTELCLHSTRVPPTLVAVEQGFDAGQTSDDWQAHDQPGWIVWQGSHDALIAFLESHPSRRVQDPTAAQAVASCRELNPSSVMDYCAGMGTKTKQLAMQFPEAAIFAADPHVGRAAALKQLAEQYAKVTVLSQAAAAGQSADLLVLDVPCSNSGVLARRPEARYRLTHQSLASVMELQRQIILQSLPVVQARQGSGTATPRHILYSTCSIEQMENRPQARWIAQQVAGEIVHEKLILPAGRGPSWNDGGYHALIKLPS